MKTKNNIIILEGSKSILNRVLIISSFLPTPLEISNISHCDDVITLVNNLEKLGFHIKIKNNSLTIIPPKKISNLQRLNIKDSGTAFRFLISRLAVLEGIESSIDVSLQLKCRPIKQLIEILKRIGVDIRSEKFPIKIFGKKLIGGEYGIQANISSQFISSLLLISPLFQTDFILNLSGNVVSQSYIEMTLQIMKDFGIKSNYKEKRIIIPAGQYYINLKRYLIEPDFSSACYFWALGSLSLNKICTFGNIKNSCQPDYKFLKILEKMGAQIEMDNNKICVKKNKLCGIEVDFKDMPDQTPTLTILALLANSPTKIKNISHLKFKESNRIDALIKEIRRIGGKISYEDNSLIINPLNFEPPKIKLNTYNDHRLVMSFYILKALFPQIEIENKECVKKSYPNFLKDFKKVTKTFNFIT
ncbi:MAG: 3-phosphoshikimate 1-carboxyvinyltransferase [Bacteroidetes bacterium]|nr:MAG: 3-phosphoshikimate 1-carboxyvinyltransferase [Bacteroidota bacterium]